MKTLWKILEKWLAGIKSKLTGIKAEPHKVAMGYALGVFLATTPFVGLKVFIAIALTFLFKWSKGAAIFGVLHVNFVTGPIFYGFSYLVGRFVLGAEVSTDVSFSVSIGALIEILTTNSIVFLSLLAGGVILGLPLAVAAYFISNSFFHHKSSLKPKAL